jgi:CHRD domain
MALTASPHRLLALTALMFAATLAQADNGRDRIEARLKSTQEVPSVLSAANGRLRATIDKASSAISYELSYSGLEGPVRMAHIHLGQRGVNGGIMVWLCQTAAFADPTGLSPTCPASGSVSGLLQAGNVLGIAAQGLSATEFAEVLSAIRAGVAYVNVHSDRFPGGEIRGQLRDDD